MASPGTKATPGQVIAWIAEVSEAIAWQAGVGAMETAGSIVSYLAEHPEDVDAFMQIGSVLDWPMTWHREGRLSWHGQDGKIYHPEAVRSAMVAKSKSAGI